MSRAKDLITSLQLMTVCASEANQQALKSIGEEFDRIQKEIESVRTYISLNLYDAENGNATQWVDGEIVSDMLKQICN